MKAKHTGVFGDSGGGKTTKMREYHATFPGLSIWINHNSERVPDGKGFDHATTVYSYDELLEAVYDGYTAINYVVSDRLEGIEHARSIGYNVIDSGSVQIIVDEVHEIWPDEDVDNAVKNVMHEDRDEDIRLMFATQDPSDLKPYTPLKQTKWFVWCGEWNGFHEGFLNAHSWFPKNKLPTEDYNYVVIDKRGNILSKGKTNPEYA